MKSFFCLKILFCLAFFQNTLYSRTIFYDDYRQLANQAQLNQYGTIKDFVTLPDGNYVAIYSNFPSDPNFRKTNINEGSVFLCGLNSNFQIIWQYDLTKYYYIAPYVFTYDFYIDEEKQLFAAASGVDPINNAPMLLINLKDGSNTRFFLDNTALALYFHIQFIDSDHFAFIIQNYPAEIRIYNIHDETYVSNPHYVETLKNYLTEMRIKDFCIDRQTGMWLFRFVDSEIAPKIIQTAIYSPTSGYFLKLFSVESYQDLCGVSMKFSPDKLSLILLANSSSYKYYLLTGKNNLICKDYSLVNGLITPIVEPTQYWNLGNSGEYFLLKNNGLYQEEI